MNNRALAIQKIITDEKLTKKEFANIIGIQPQNLSRCLLSNKISEKMCRKIIEHFPKYKIEWLLGYDDYATDIEQVLAKGYIKINSTCLYSKDKKKLVIILDVGDKS